MLRSLLPLLLLAACTGTSDDDAQETDVETVPTESDTDTDTDASSSGFDTDDTGAYYAIAYEGYATVAPDVSFSGQQSLSAVWMKGLRTPSRPRCIYGQELSDWETAYPGEVNRLEDELPLCPECDFAFTVVILSTETTTHFPWSEPAGPPDVVAPGDFRRRLDCDILQNQLEFPTPEDIMGGQLWQGVGFDAEGDGDDDPNTGLVYVWNTRSAGVWASGYEATFDPYSGQFHWYGFDRPLDFYY